MDVQVPVSDLVVATTPLTGAELVPIVQGGVTKQTTTSAFGLSDGALLWADQALTSTGVNSLSSTAVMVEESPAIDHAHIDGDGKLVIDEVGIYTGIAHIQVSNINSTGSLRGSAVQLDMIGTTDILGTGVGIIQPTTGQSFFTGLPFTFSAVPTVGDLTSFTNQAVVGDPLQVTATWADMSLTGTLQARWDLFLFKVS